MGRPSFFISNFTGRVTYWQTMYKSVKLTEVVQEF